MDSQKPDDLDVFDYLDPYLFLTDYLENEQKRDSSFSLRFFAFCVEIDASLFVKILKGDRHLSKVGVEAVIAFFQLDVKWILFDTVRAEYFRELVFYIKSKRDTDIQKHFERLMKMRPLNSSQLQSDQYKYFQYWYIPAIRSALDFVHYSDKNDAEKFSQCFLSPVSIEDVIDGIDVLERLKLITRDSQNNFRSSESHIGTGDKWQSSAIRLYQKKTILLSSESIDTVPNESRDISTVTLSLNEAHIKGIKAILADARKSVIQNVNEIKSEECTNVYQLNMQFFPIVKVK
ncbi:MAG: TIGR02147 family protein [Fibrobacterales bacterium]